MAYPRNAPFDADAIRLGIEYMDPKALQRPSRSTRKHSDRQSSALEAALDTFGVVVPVPVDADNRIIDGDALVQAAIRLGLTKVPVVRISHLSPAQLRALRLTLNRLSELGAWDIDELRMEIGEILTLDVDFPLEVMGWNTAELDVLMTPLASADANEPEEVPPVQPVAISQAGDVWQLGRHRLICGSSLEPGVWRILMQGRRARMGFTDPPFNCPVAGHVSGLGKKTHREFAMASGEMSDTEFEAFLNTALTRMAEQAEDGAILSVCMDWRGLPILYAAARAAGLSVLNLCVWNKTNGAMGSLYRSKHELVYIFKVGKAPHINNVELGKHGRYRTNVWDYAGANSFGKGRMADLADHPTVKPTALVADAIRDVTRHGDIVIDGFIGSGSTILAAERADRICYGVELDPLYVDVAIRRWQEATGKEAMLEASGLPFNAVKAERCPEDGASDDEPDVDECDDETVVPIAPPLSRPRPFRRAA